MSVVVVLGLGATVGAATVVPGLKPPFGTNWTMYHQNLMSSGVDPVNTDLNTLKPGWSSPNLDGGIFGEPLVADGRVVVATANNSVYALSAQTGGILWGVHLGTPVPVSAVPCPSVVSPIVGITGTPFIDLAQERDFRCDHGADRVHRSAPPLRPQPLRRDRRAQSERRPPRLAAASGVSARRADGVTGPDHHRLYRLRRLRDLPRLGGRHPRDGRPDEDLRDRDRLGPDLRRHLDGRRLAGGGSRGQHLGHRRQRQRAESCDGSLRRE